MNWKYRYKRFLVWQRQPHQVAPLSQEEHCCPTCRTRYQGNFCPRCGQSARIGRYSFVGAFLLFIDVWGLGNRGMFRSMRDLILRPGYMIRDYLGGMRMAYFPPFKMFFLITTLSLIINSGLNIQGYDSLTEWQQSRERSFDMRNNDEAKVLNEAKTDSDRVKTSVKSFSAKAVLNFLDFQDKYPNLFSLSFLVLISGILFVFFRKCPTIPDLRYSEFLVGLVYISNMLSIYNVVLNFFCVRGFIMMLPMLTAIIALKQLSGYEWWRTTLFALVSLFIFTVLVIVFVMSLIFGSYFYYSQGV